MLEASDVRRVALRAGVFVGGVAVLIAVIGGTLWSCEDGRQWMTDVRIQASIRPQLDAVIDGRAESIDAGAAFALAKVFVVPGNDAKALSAAFLHVVRRTDDAILDELRYRVDMIDAVATGVAEGSPGINNELAAPIKAEADRLIAAHLQLAAAQQGAMQEIWSQGYASQIFKSTIACVPMPKPYGATGEAAVARFSTMVAKADAPHDCITAAFDKERIEGVPTLATFDCHHIHGDAYVAGSFSVNDYRIACPTPASVPIGLLDKKPSAPDSRVRRSKEAAHG